MKQGQNIKVIRKMEKEMVLANFITVNRVYIMVSGKTIGCMAMEF